MGIPERIFGQLVLLAGAPAGGPWRAAGAPVSFDDVLSSGPFASAESAGGGGGPAGFRGRPGRVSGVIFANPALGDDHGSTLEVEDVEVLLLGDEPGREVLPAGEFHQVPPGLLAAPDGGPQREGKKRS